jgi:hypothetical protein
MLGSMPNSQGNPQSNYPNDPPYEEPWQSFDTTSDYQAIAPGEGRLERILASSARLFHKSEVWDAI